MKVRRSVLKDTVTVRTRSGEGSYGDVLSDPVTVACLIDESRRLVRDGTGQETVSEATLTLHPRTRVGTAMVNPMDLLSEESEVTIGTRVSRVITAKELRIRGCTVAVEVTCG